MKRLLTFAVALSAAACSGETSEPAGPTGPTDGPEEPSVADVSVTAPNGAILDVGASAAFTAAATDTDGDDLSASFTWSSSDESVVTVASSGLVTAGAVGRATVMATADGVTGSLEVRVVEADVEGLAVLLDDPFAEELLSGLDSEVSSVWSECDAALSAGNLADLEDCLGRLRSALDSDTDAARGPLRALVGLFADWLDRFLNLQ